MGTSDWNDLSRSLARLNQNAPVRPEANEKHEGEELLDVNGTWEYANVVFTQVKIDGAVQWATEATGGYFKLDTALDRMGRHGWELVSFGPERFGHFDSVRNVSGEALAHYPFQSTKATVQRAVFKRRTS